MITARIKSYVFLKLVGFIFIVMVNLNGYSQEITNNMTDEERLEAIKSIRQKDPKKAKPYAQELLEKATESNDSKYMYHANYQLAKINGTLGKHENSIIFFEQALTIARLEENKYWVARTLTSIGKQYLDSNYNNEAMELFYESLEISKQEGFDEHIRFNSNNIALLKIRIRDYESALKILREYLNDVKELEPKGANTNYVNHLLMMSSSFSEMEELDSSLVYGKMALSISKKTNYAVGINYSLASLGIINIKKKNYSSALDYLLNAEKYDIELGNKTNLASTNYYLGKCYYEQGDYNLAINKLHKALEVSEKEEIVLEELPETYNLLAKANANLGNQKKVDFYKNKYEELYTKKIDDKITLANELNKRDIQELHSEIDQINKEKEKQQNFLKLLIGLIISASILVVIFYRKNKRKNKKRFQELMSELGNSKPISKVKSTYSELPIDDKKIETILKNLEKLEEKEFYLEQRCNLYTVSKKINTNTTYLSKAINTHKKMSFNTYINQLRIDYVIKRLKKDKKFRSYSVQHIAKEVGYKRAASFSRYFKKQTGLYLSFYIKEINKAEKNNI